MSRDGHDPRTPRDDREPRGGRDPRPARDGRDPRDPDASHGRPIEAVPGLARIAVGSWWRGASWTTGASVRAGTAVVRRLPGGEAVVDVAEEAGRQTRERVRHLLGVTAVEKSVQRLGEPAAGQRGGDATPAPISARTLRARGAGLLERSADVDADDDAHPAYARILGEIAPDEARILRLLAEAGAQTAVDIRQAGPLGLSSDLTATTLTMLGFEAGCRYTERTPAYLNNLQRLGLVEVRRTELDDLRGYQVLEAQPFVTDELSKAGRNAKTVRRGIDLTPFGADFVHTCLPLEPPARGSEPGVHGRPGERRP